MGKGEEHYSYAYVNCKTYADFRNASVKNEKNKMYLKIEKIWCLLYLRATLIAQLIKICLQCRRPWFDSWVGTSPGEGIGYPFWCSWASLVAQLLKNLPVMQETWVPSLGWEDPLERGKATHSSI